MPVPFSYQALHDLIEADSTMGFKNPDGSWKTASVIVSLAEARNRTPPQGFRTVTVDDVWQYLLDRTEGSGVNERPTLDKLREFGESGTIRGVPPTPATGLSARQASARHLWNVLRSAAGTQVAFPISTGTRNMFTALGQGQIDGFVFSTVELQGLQALADAPITWTEEQFGLDHVLTVNDITNAETL